MKKIKLSRSQAIQMFKYACFLVESKGMTPQEANNYVSRKFAAIPELTGAWDVNVQSVRKFESDVVAQNAFLKRCSHFVKNDLTGELVYYDLSPHVLKRTEITDSQQRGPSITGTKRTRSYLLEDWEADAYISYTKLDHYLTLPNWPAAMLADIQTKIANDILFVGWNGVARDSTTTIADVTRLYKGWIQKVREEDATRIISEIVENSGKIFFGVQRVKNFDSAAVVDNGDGTVALPMTAHGYLAGAQIVVTGTTNYNGTYLVLAASTANAIHITHAYTAEDLAAATAKATQNPDYANLDELAVDLKYGIPDYRRNGLEVLYSDDMAGDEEAKLFGSHGSTPTEKAAIEKALSKIGKMSSSTPDFFPSNALIVTNPSNFSTYSHVKLRRKVEEKEELKGIVHWNLGKKDFNVENLDQFAMAENIYELKSA